jgi:hypothetical protein
MCEFSGKLIAWMDHELPAGEAAEVERHLGTCEQCQTSLNAYRTVSAAVDAYCEAAITAKARRRLPHRAVLSGLAAATAAVVVLFVVFPRAHVQQPSLRPDATEAAVAPSVIATQTTETAQPYRVKRAHRRRAVAPANIQQAHWLPAAPAIQIAFPAEAIFPPGAIPQGFDFVADVSIAADGSAQQLRLRP